MWDEHRAVDLLKGLKAKGAQTFWVDIKLHDTADTVARRAAIVAKAGGGVVTVHATGGIMMMKGAVDSGVPKVLAVMLLTSLSNEEVRRYYNRTPAEIIPILVEDALEAGVTGFITPPTQVKLLAELRRKHGKPFEIVTPGTRSTGAVTHDQVQVDTPLGAMQNGANFLVLGRQVTAAKNPSLAFQKLIAEVSPALVARAS